MQLSDSQVEVLRAFSDVGEMDDQVLVALVHHRTNLSSSGIRSRRAELVRKGALIPSGIKRLRSGRNAAIHRISYRGKQALAKADRLAAKAAVA